MDWSNERYVRYYVRDTVTFSTWPWQAQALLGPLMRRLDRAGVIDVGDHDPIDAVWSLYPRWPRDVIEVGLTAMLKAGTIRYEGDRLLMPHFLDAQEAKQSDAQRQRESRARKRDIAALSSVTNRDDAVTERDPLTSIRSEPSHGVTPCRAVPNRTEPTNDPVLPDGNTGPRRAARTVRRKAPRNQDDRTLPLDAHLPGAPPIPDATAGDSASDGLPGGTQPSLPMAQPGSTPSDGLPGRSPDAIAGDDNDEKPSDANAGGNAEQARKRRARAVFGDYERQRVAVLHGDRGTARSMTDEDYRAMVRLMRHVRQELQCDEAAAWDAVAEYGRLAIAEAHAAIERGDSKAKSLVTWRRGPSAWRKSRYETVMAESQAAAAVPINGAKRKVKHDDITGQPYFVDDWGRRRACDEQGRLPGEDGYVGG